jgi:nonsense-mediated mRNA decay protein 3
MAAAAIIYLYLDALFYIEMVTTSSLFCPRCGKETEQEGLCQACFQEKYIVFEVPQVIDVVICAKCPSYKVGELWVSTKLKTYEELAKKAASKNIRLLLKINKEVRDPVVSISSEFINPNILKARIAVEGSIEGRAVKTEADVEARIRKETCDVCSRIAGGYYEAVVQIRAQGRLPTKKELQRCLKLADDVIAKAERSGDRLAFVSDVIELPEGTDVYLGSTAAARQIARAIVDEMGGTIIESPKLVGAKEGKGLYRVTFAVRLPSIVPGDIVKMHGSLVLVEKVGRRISGTDLATGFSTSMPAEEEPEKVASASEAASTVLVSEEANSVQILDPATYAPLTIKRPAFLNKKPGEDVRVIKTRDGVFLLPGGSRGEE